jgi:hypothetical protein
LHLNIIIEIYNEQTEKLGSSSNEVYEMLKKYGFKFYIIDNDYFNFKDYIYVDPRKSLALKSMDNVLPEEADVFCTRESISPVFSGADALLKRPSE